MELRNVPLVSGLIDSIINLVKGKKAQLRNLK